MPAVYRVLYWIQYRLLIQGVVPRSTGCSAGYAGYLIHYRLPPCTEMQRPFLRVPMDMPTVSYISVQTGIEQCTQQRKLNHGRCPSFTVRLRPVLPAGVAFLVPFCSSRAMRAGSRATRRGDSWLLGRGGRRVGGGGLSWFRFWITWLR